MPLPSTSSRILAALVALVAWFGQPALAQAEHAPLTLDWQAPPGCPVHDQIEREVLALLGQNRSFASSLHASARIEQRVEPTADGRFELSLRTVQSGVEGERRFSGNSCRAVSDAAIVTMALSIDPNLEVPRDFGDQRRAAPDTNPAVATPAQTKTEASRKPVPAAAPSSSPRSIPPRASLPRIAAPAASTPATNLLLHGNLGWRWGAQPESTFEAGVGIGIERGWILGLAELALAPRTVAYSETRPGAGGSFSMQYGGLTACAIPSRTRLLLSPCLGLGFTHLFAKGFGVEPRRNGSLAWGSILAGLLARYSLSRPVALLLAAEVHLALRQPQAFLLDADYPSGMQTIFRPDRVAYLARTGVEFRIW